MYSPFEKSMIALSESLGSEELAILLRPSGGIEQGSSDTPVPSSIPVLSTEQQQASNGFDVQHHSPESDSDVSIDHGFIPDNAITRDIIRAIKEREPLPSTNSSWTIPQRFRSFNAASKALPSSSAASGDFIASNLPFKARLDSLFYRCRLLVFEESANMLEVRIFRVVVAPFVLSILRDTRHVLKLDGYPREEMLTPKSSTGNPSC